MRRFTLHRLEDETGISGTGYVADGIQFRNMKCVLCWRTAFSSVAVYDDMETLEKIHGHDGKTVVEWVDPEIDEYSNSVNPAINARDERFHQLQLHLRNLARLVKESGTTIILSPKIDGIIILPPNVSEAEVKNVLTRFVLGLRTQRITPLTGEVDIVEVQLTDYVMQVPDRDPERTERILQVLKKTVTYYDDDIVLKDRTPTDGISPDDTTTD